MKSISIIFAIGVGLGASVMPTSASTTNVASKTTTSWNTQELAHQGGKATHRHCHTRIKKRKVVKVCHKHKHRVLHHLRTG